MMRNMKFVVARHKLFCPFYMKQVMDIAECCPSPEKPGKKGKVIIQLICNVNKHTAENKKQNPVQQCCLKLCRICMMMLMSL
jgi:hypothetical protein